MPVSIGSERISLSDERCSVGPVIIKFTADWCGPCKRIQPQFEELASRPENDKVLFAICDVDKEEELSGRANVRSLPTFLFLLNGGEIGRIEGSNIDGVAKMTAELVRAAFKQKKKEASTPPDTGAPL